MGYYWSNDGGDAVLVLLLVRVRWDLLLCQQLTCHFYVASSMGTGVGCRGL